MKRIILITLMLVVAATKLHAQPFDTETKTISLSAGLESRFGGVPLVLSFEHNLYNFNDDMGIRVGGIFGWSTVAYDCAQYYDDGGAAYAYGENRYNNFSMAFRGSFYYVGVKKVDLYAGILTGYNIQTGNTNWNNQSDEERFGNVSNPKSQFVLGVMIGARYEFTDNIGAFVEGGYGLSYVSIGLSYRFRKQFFGRK